MAKPHLRKKNGRWEAYADKTAPQPYIRSFHLWMLMRVLSRVHNQQMNQRDTAGCINEEEMMFGVTSPGGN